MFYRIAAARVTTSSRVEVRGERTTGEAEFVLLKEEGRLWVGLGSDHTDRNIEVQDAALAKQACEKPVCAEFWSFDEIEDHWDALRLRSFVRDSEGARTIYQEGSVAAMLHPRELLARWDALGAPGEGALLFCGTLPTIGAIRPAALFEFELEDPVLGRRLSHQYEVLSLPPYLGAA
jgi:hypothetical protein